MRTNQMSRIYLGHNVYGLAAVIFGVITLAWRDLNAWREIMPFGKVTHPEILLYTAAAIELFGGFAIQWPRTKRIGAFSLGSIYFIFALFSVPQIVARPLTYNSWGSFFERVRVLWSLRCFVCGRTAGLSLGNGRVGSEMDSSRTIVLGDCHYGCVRACGLRAAFKALCSACVSIAHDNARWIWASRVAADCRLGPT